MKNPPAVHRSRQWLFRLPAAVLGLAACALLAACGERAPVAADGDTADSPTPDATPAALTGADLWLACQGCHSIDAGAPQRVGPNLHGIVGRPAASRPGYTYSEALSGSGITWSPGLLRGYIMNPESMVPGTWMAYRDVMTPAELDRLVDYVVERAAGAEDGEGRDD
ncbi:c-type cytochrome [Lentisalinibacter sediminis]|uniref:c-type cytochrome n=1 Tax=Lentisalinibacter sediminis TaxID=2992237 RepID=UPI00386E7A27